MEQQVTSTTTKGIILGLILVVISIAIYFAGVDLNGPVKWVSNVIFFAGIIVSVYNYGKQINYHSTFGNYFAHGFKVSAVVACLMIIYLVIFVFVFPEFKEKGLEQARMSMRQNPNMTEEQITQALSVTKKFFMVFIVGGALVVYLFLGAIAALIGAAITKKDANPAGALFNQPIQ